jgi:hypothetical protein
MHGDDREKQCRYHYNCNHHSHKDPYPLPLRDRLSVIGLICPRYHNLEPKLDSIDTRLVLYSLFSAASLTSSLVKARPFDIRRCPITAGTQPTTQRSGESLTLWARKKLEATICLGSRHAALSLGCLIAGVVLSNLEILSVLLQQNITILSTRSLR